MDYEPEVMDDNVAESMTKYDDSYGNIEKIDMEEYRV